MVEIGLRTYELGEPHHRHEQLLKHSKLRKDSERASQNNILARGTSSSLRAITAENCDSYTRLWKEYLPARGTSSSPPIDQLRF